MVRLICGLILAGPIAVGFAAAQHSIRLQDGQSFTVSGTLALQPAGRLQFVAIVTADQYVPVVGGRDMPATHRLGLSGYNRYDVLYRHRGQAVTVTGKVMTDAASPYYLQNASFKAASIRLADGTELLGTPRVQPPVAADVGQYSASVLLPADLSAPWRYSGHGQPDPERQFLSCSSNGGGDVVNCSCARGFHPIAAEAASGATRLRSELLDTVAQVLAGDDAHPKAVTITVTCSR